MAKMKRRLATYPIFEFSKSRFVPGWPLLIRLTFLNLFVNLRWSSLVHDPTTVLLLHCLELSLGNVNRFLSLIVFGTWDLNLHSSSHFGDHVYNLWPLGQFGILDYI